MGRISVKILCAALCCTMLTAFLPGQLIQGVAQSVYYYENFNSVAPGELPEGWYASSGGAYVYQMEHSLYRALKIQATDKAVLVNKMLDAPVQGAFGFQAEYSLEQYQDFAVELRDTQDNVFRLIQFDKSGNINMGGKPVFHYEPDKNYTVTITVNTVENRYGVNVNGTEAGTARIQTAYAFSGFRFRTEPNHIASSLNIAYISIHSGKGQLPMRDLLVYTSSSTEILHPLYETYTAEAHLNMTDKLALVYESNHAAVDGYRTLLYPQNNLVTTLRENDIYYAPLEFFANYLNVAVAWNDNNDEAAITYGDTEITVNLNEETVMLLSESANKQYPVLTKEGIVYVPVCRLSEDIGKFVLKYNRLLLISDNPITLDPVTDEELWEEITRIVLYSRPKGDVIVNDIISNTQGQHPRLLFNREQLEEIKQKIHNDEQTAQMYVSIKAAADRAYNQEVGSLTHYNDYRFGIQQMSFVYLVENDTKYAQRVYEEIKTRVDSPTWLYSSYLALSVVALGTAVGYDWIYDYLTPEQRIEIENAILTKSLQFSLDIVYRSPTTQGQSWWSATAGNWNAVCNSGIAISALAVADVYPEVCGEVLEVTLRSMEYMLSDFQQGGGWWEGFDYWEFTMNQLFPYFASLELSAGTDYGYIYDVPGLKETVEFPFYTIGPGGVFDFGDSNSGSRNNPAAYYIADKLGKPELAAYNLKVAKDKYKTFYKVEDIIWYNPQNISANDSYSYSRLYKQIDLASFRNTWRFNSGAFLSMIGSYTMQGHGNAHAGSFIYDALGERWAKDLAKDDYGLPGYFGEGRQLYYRMRAEGHNTIVINPDESLGQDGVRESEIIAYDANDNGGYAIADLTRVYSSYVSDFKRGVLFDAQTEGMVVQDEIELKSPQDVWWFMHTDAVVEIAEDGRSATLIKGSRSVRAVINSPAGAKFQVMQAKPLPSSPNPPVQNINEGTRKLYIKLPVQNKATISVSIAPDNKLDGSVTALNEWRVDETRYARVEKITVGGALIDNFESRERYYELESPNDGNELPPVDAFAGENETVHIVTQDIPGGSKLHIITVTSNDESISPNTYFVRQYGYKIEKEKPAKAKQHTIMNVENLTELVSDPKLTADGTASTSVVYSTYAEFVYDLGSVKDIGYVAAGWNATNTRRVRFDVYTSPDGRNWTKVFDGRSSGVSTRTEYYKVDDSFARYVKLCTRQTEHQSWVTLYEFEVYTAELDPEETKLVQVEAFLNNTYRSDKEYVAVWSLYIVGNENTRLLKSVDVYPLSIKSRQQQRIIYTHEIPRYMQNADFDAKVLVFDSLSGMAPQLEAITRS